MHQGKGTTLKMAKCLRLNTPNPGSRDEERTLTDATKMSLTAADMYRYGDPRRPETMAVVDIMKKRLLDEPL
jgi:hypothetical protein